MEHGISLCRERLWKADVAYVKVCHTMFVEGVMDITVNLDHETCSQHKNNCSLLLWTGNGL
jgi:hypothetical protein